MQCYVSFIINIYYDDIEQCLLLTFFFKHIKHSIWNEGLVRECIFFCCNFFLTRGDCVNRGKDDVTHFFFFIFQIQFTLFNELPVCFYIEHGWLVLRWHEWSVQVLDVSVHIDLDVGQVWYKWMGVIYHCKLVS